MRPSAFMIAIASASVALSACSSSSNSSSGNSPADSGPPTFTAVYTQVIATQCLTCHVPGEDGVIEGALDMSTQATAYANLVNVPAAGSSCATRGTRVIPNDPNDSLLFEKVSSSVPPCGSRMPLDAAPLGQSSINLINDWIAAGAQND